MEYIEKKRSWFFGLPICFTTYKLMDTKITITSGFLNIVEDDAFMYKVQDVRLTRSAWERIFRLGTVTCYTGDTTHPELKLCHIRNSAKIKNFLMDASEEARRQRRTMHTLDISASEDLDDDFGRSDD